MSSALANGGGGQRLADAGRRVYSVSELTREVRGTLESRYPEVWVEGEISNFKPHSSGHWYFTLKDEEAQLRAVMFRGQNSRLRFRPEDGMQVLCRGRVTVYEKRGEYQVIVEEMQPRGSGALLLAFEQLKARLQAEGLFDATRKRPLPLRPRRVGIVTSPEGAAIRDMLRVIRRRDPRMPVLICPAKVQGEGAGAEIAEAITRLGHSGLVEVIIVGRGGGSIEDLWAFNEEVVARAIAAAPVPIVSGVGHEVDFTIADFVADLRAATPSVAAELTVPVRAQLEEAVFVLRARLDRAVRRRVTELRHTLGNARGRLPDPRRRLASLRFELDDGVHRAATGMRRRCSGARRELARLAAALRQRHPSARVGRARERTGKLRRRLEAAMAAGLAERRRFLAVIEGKLEALSPVAILERGYAIARRPDGRVLRRAAEARVGEPLEVLLGEGALGVRVETTLPQTGQLALQLGENS